MAEDMHAGAVRGVSLVARGGLVIAHGVDLPKWAKSASYHVHACVPGCERMSPTLVRVSIKSVYIGHSAVYRAPSGACFLARRWASENVDLCNYEG